MDDDNVVPVEPANVRDELARKRLIKSVIGMAVLILLLVALPATVLFIYQRQTIKQQASAAQNYYVDADNGSDTNDGKSPDKAFKSLSKFVHIVEPGSIVYLKGTFSGQTLGSISGSKEKPVTIKSLDSNNPAVIDKGNDGAGKAGFVILLAGKIKNENGKITCLEKIHDITIENVTFTNSVYLTELKPAAMGVHLLCAENITLKNNKFEHIALTIQQSSNNLIEGNVIREVVNTYGKYYKSATEFEYRPMSGGDSLFVYDGSNNNKIQYNQFYNAGHATLEIGIGDPNAPKSSGNKVIGNYISNEYATPFYIAVDGENTLVENNSMVNGTKNAAYSLASYDCPDYNHLENCKKLQARAGIGIRGSNNVVRRNFAYYNTGPGLTISAFIGDHDWILDASNNKIYNNIFFNNGEEGLRITRSWSQENKDKGLREPQLANNEIYNNIFYKNKGRLGYQNNIFKTIWIETTGIAPSWPLQGNLNGNRIFNNVFLRDGGNAGEDSVTIVRPGKFTYFTLSDFQSKYPQAAQNNIEVNPLFVNEALPNGLFDFKLQATSPLIDKGIIISDSLSGSNIAYNGSAPDIGVYEFEVIPTITPTNIPTHTPTPTILQLPSLTPIPTCVGRSCIVNNIPTPTPTVQSGVQAPTNLVVNSVTSTSIQVSWSNMATSYSKNTVGYSKANDTQWTFFDLPRGSTTAMISNLTSGQQYYVYVKTCNDADICSDWAKVSATTLNDPINPNR